MQLRQTLLGLGCVCVLGVAFAKVSAEDKAGNDANRPARADGDATSKAATDTLTDEQKTQRMRELARRAQERIDAHEAAREKAGEPTTEEERRALAEERRRASDKVKAYLAELEKRKAQPAPKVDQKKAQPKPEWHRFASGRYDEVGKAVALQRMKLRAVNDQWQPKVNAAAEKIGAYTDRLRRNGMRHYPPVTTVPAKGDVQLIMDISYKGLPAMPSYEMDDAERRKRVAELKEMILMLDNDKILRGALVNLGPSHVSWDQIARRLKDDLKFEVDFRKHREVITITLSNATVDEARSLDRLHNEFRYRLTLLHVHASIVEDIARLEKTLKVQEEVLEDIQEALEAPNLSPVERRRLNAQFTYSQKLYQVERKRETLKERKESRRLFEKKVERVTHTKLLRVSTNLQAHRLLEASASWSRQIHTAGFVPVSKGK